MKPGFPFRPELADTLKNNSRQDFHHDLVAGLTVGIVALPLAIGASLLLVKRLSDVTHVTADEEVTQASASGQATIGKEIPDGVTVFRVFGVFFFEVVDKLDDELQRANMIMRALVNGSRALSQGAQVTILSSGNGKPNS